MQNLDTAAGAVNYDDVPIAQVEIEGVDYRADAGLGSAVAISKRETGTWTWAFAAQGKWDGRRLRAKGLDSSVLSALGQALAAAMAERAEWNH